MKVVWGANVSDLNVKIRTCNKHYKWTSAHLWKPPQTCNETNLLTVPLWSPDTRVCESWLKCNAVNGMPLKEKSLSLCRIKCHMNTSNNHNLTTKMLIHQAITRAGMHRHFIWVEWYKNIHKWYRSHWIYKFKFLLCIIKVDVERINEIKSKATWIPVGLWKLLEAKVDKMHPRS